MRRQLVAASGREWRYSPDLRWLLQASVVQRKAKSGIIQLLCTCVAAFGVGVVACGVLRIPILLERSFICFTPSHVLKSVPTIPIKPMQHEPFRQCVKCKIVHCCHSQSIRLTACNTGVSFATDNRSTVRTTTNIVKH